MFIPYFDYATILSYIQLTFTCSKSTIKTPETGVKYVQNQQQNHQNNVIDKFDILLNLNK